MTDFLQPPNDSLFRLAKDTPLTQGEAAYYLKQNWKNLFQEDISETTLSILWSQCAVETAGFTSIKNWNFGNIRKRPGKLYTSYKCHEYLNNGQRLDIVPFDPRSFFQAWEDINIGLQDYISFLQQPRYALAFKAAKSGDAVLYVTELKNGGYFTAEVTAYTKAVLNWQAIFKQHQDIYWNYIPSMNLIEKNSIINTIVNSIQNILGLK